MPVRLSVLISTLREAFRCITFDYKAGQECVCSTVIKVIIPNVKRKLFFYVMLQNQLRSSLRTDWSSLGKPAVLEERFPCNIWSCPLPGWLESVNKARCLRFRSRQQQVLVCVCVCSSQGGWKKETAALRHSQTRTLVHKSLSTPIFSPLASSDRNVPLPGFPPFSQRFCFHGSSVGG